MDFIGKFEVLESFAIKKRKQFYFLGKLKEGEIRENWYVNVGFNKDTFMSIKIDSIDKIILSSDSESNLLLIIDCDDEMMEFLLLFNISLETLFITIDGND